MKEFSEFSPNFKTAKISSYSLLLQIDKEGIAYSIADNFRKNYLAIVRKNFKEPVLPENLTQVVKEIIDKETYLNKRYKNVNLIYTSERYTLIPAEFFDKKLVRKIFSLNHYLADNEEVHFNDLKNNIYNLYTFCIFFFSYCCHLLCFLGIYDIP